MSATLKNYLREQSLDLPLDELSVATLALSAVLQAEKPDASGELFHYPVPLLGEGGSCSLVDQLADEPYDLTPVLGGQTPEARGLLTNLKALIGSSNHQVGADWLGIYAVRGAGDEARLVKLAYHGRPSRAEFPLTEAFAQISNNSRVGLSGWGAVIDDVAQWSALGGGYYNCDPAVQSEVCLPVLAVDGKVLGIIDAESCQPAFFDPARQVWLAALALVLAQPLASPPLASAEVERQ